jgi:type I restriction enzyme S subunit
MMDINRNLSVLPETWRWVSLGDLLSFIGSGVTPKGGKRQYQQVGVPFIRSQNVLPGSIRFDDLVHISPKLHEELSRTHIKPNDILLNITGASIGRSAVTPYSFGQGNVNQHVCILRPFPCICARYISWFLNSSIGQAQIMSSQSGVTRQGLNYKQIKALSIPLAPQAEQYSIASRIEELFSDLDSGVKALDRIRVLLKRYHQSILKAALQGELTRDWRDSHPEIEPPIIPLERTKDDSQFQEKVKLSNLDPKISIFFENNSKDSPIKIDIQILKDLYKFPKRWVWANFGQICERVTVGHVGAMKEEYVNRGIPFLRSQNVRENRFDPIGLKFITKEFHEKLGKSKLEPGDLVVTRSGNTGISCVIPDSLKEANCSDLIIIKQPKAIYPQYGAFYMNSLAKSLVNAQKVGVALGHFNTKSMEKMPIPVPPLLEQRLIISKLNTLLLSLKR